MNEKGYGDLFGGVLGEKTLSHKPEGQGEHPLCTAFSRQNHQEKGGGDSAMGPKGETWQGTKHPLIPTEGG